MTDQPTDDRLAEARRDFNAAQYVIAQFTGDAELEAEVFRRLAAYGERGCLTGLFVRGLNLIAEKTDLVELEPVVLALRGYVGRIVARFGERLDTGDDDTVIDPAEISAEARRLLGGEGGVP